MAHREAMHRENRGGRVPAPGKLRQPHDGQQHHGRPSIPPTPLLILAILVTWLGIFLVRLYGPPNIEDGDQLRPSAYVLDLLENGNWIVQRDDTGDVTSKPPVYTWTVSLTALAVGRLNQFALYLPGALAMLGLSLLVFRVGLRSFGRGAAIVGALALLLSTVGVKQVHLARTDALFAFLCFSTALVGWRAAQGKTHWLFFWLLAALATLTKHPLGLIFPIGGVLGFALAARRGWHWPNEQRPVLSAAVVAAAGACLYVAICGGWLFLAWLKLGDPVIEKMIGRELVQHALGPETALKIFGADQLRLDDSDKESKGLLERLPAPVIYYFLPRFAPWSLFAMIGIAMVLLRPARDDTERRAEGFLAGYFVLGAIILSLSPHQRWDHMLPLLPAAALLAGREAVRLIPRGFWRVAVLVYPIFLLLFLGGVWIAFQLGRGEGKILRSIQAQRAAADIRAVVGDDFPIMHVDGTMPLQIFRGTMRPRVPLEQAQEALDSNRAAYVVIHDRRNYATLFPGGLGPHYELMRWEDDDPEDGPYMRLVSNRPKLDWQDRMIFFNEGLRVETDALVLDHMGGGRFRFSAQGLWRVVITNRNRTPQNISVSVTSEAGEKRHRQTLQPGETMSLKP